MTPKQQYENGRASLVIAQQWYGLGRISKEEFSRQCQAAFAQMDQATAHMVEGPL